jgi:hypothetical protein
VAVCVKASYYEDTLLHTSMRTDSGSGCKGLVVLVWRHASVVLLCPHTHTSTTRPLPTLALSDLAVKPLKALSDLAVKPLKGLIWLKVSSQVVACLEPE